MYINTYFRGIITPREFVRGAKNDVIYYQTQKNTGHCVQKAQCMLSNTASKCNARIKQVKITAVNEDYKAVVLIKVTLLQPAYKKPKPKAAKPAGEKNDE